MRPYNMGTENLFTLYTQNYFYKVVLDFQSCPFCSIFKKFEAYTHPIFPILLYSFLLSHTYPGNFRIRKYCMWYSMIVCLHFFFHDGTQVNYPRFIVSNVLEQIISIYIPKSPDIWLRCLKILIHQNPALRICFDFAPFRM